MRTATLSLVLLCSLPVLTECAAQDHAAAPKTPFVVEPGEVKLLELVDRAAAYLQWNILSNANEVTGGGGPPVVRLQQRIETDRDGCEDVLTSLLYRAGLAVVPMDEPKRLYELISMQGPRAREISSRAIRRSPAEILARPTLVMPVTTAVQLKHINAAIATNSLRPFFASSGGPNSSVTIGNVGNNTSLLISGFQDQVANVLRILETSDVPGPEIAPQITELIESLQKRIEALEKKLAQIQPQAR